MKKLVFILLVCGLAVCAGQSVLMQGYHNIFGRPDARIALDISSTPFVAHAAGVTDDTITGDPDLSSAFIDEVLQRANSPASGSGSLFYQRAVQSHIKPSIALAVFHHESGYGRAGVAVTTHSMGNIRCTAGWRCDPSGGYRWYPTWKDSIADFYALAHDYATAGVTTIPRFVHRYAPQADSNNEPGYVQAIRDDIARWSHGQV